MPAITFPSSSAPGQRAAEGQGRLVNVFPTPEGNQAVWRQTPGLSSFASTTRSGFRGGMQIGATLLAAWDGAVCTYAANGAETLLTGTVAGENPVTIAVNNARPTPDIVVVDRLNGAFTVSGSTVSAFSDPDLPAPNSVAFLDGYFLFSIGDGRIFASDLNDPIVDALSFANCEAKPDGLTVGKVSGQLFYGFGPESTEIWQNAGTSPFPLARVQVVSIGIRGPHCVAGDQIGWDSGLIMVSSDGKVRQWTGYQANVISTPAVERSIDGVTDTSQLFAFVSVSRDIQSWTLTGPGFTWEYNLNTKSWHERRSLGRADWRGRFSCKAFGSWICGDAENGTLWRIDPNATREGTIDVPRLVESVASRGFPARFPIYRADFDFTVGTASETGIDPIQTAPSVRISWSDDGGNTWSIPVIRALGRQGDYGRRVSLTGVGSSNQHGRKWRLEWSDPVYVSLIGGAFNEKPSVR